MQHIGTLPVLAERSLGFPAEKKEGSPIPVRGKIPGQGEIPEHFFYDFLADFVSILKPFCLVSSLEL